MLSPMKTLPFLLLLGALPSCASSARFVAGPGGPVLFDEALPPPEDDSYAPNGLELKLFTPNLGLEQDEEFKARLAQSLRTATGVQFESVRGTDKKPVYTIEIYEATYSNENDPSKLGGRSAGWVARSSGPALATRPAAVAGAHCSGAQWAAASAPSSSKTSSTPGASASA